MLEREQGGEGCFVVLFTVSFLVPDAFILCNFYIYYEHNGCFNACLYLLQVFLEIQLSKRFLIHRTWILFKTKPSKQKLELKSSKLDFCLPEVEF